jgi:hypothetical protein
MNHTKVRPIKDASILGHRNYVADESLGLIDHYRIVRGALYKGFSAASELADGNSLALLAGRLHENFRDCGRLTGELQRGPLLNIQNNVLVNPDIPERLPASSARWRPIRRPARPWLRHCAILMQRARRRLRSWIAAREHWSMAKSFAAQLADALETSWPAIARADQLPPPGDWWQIWLLLAGRGFGKTRTLAEWVCQQAASGQADKIALVAATGRMRATSWSKGKRHSRGRAALVPAGIRALETTADLAQWRDRDDI